MFPREISRYYYLYSVNTQPGIDNLFSRSIVLNFLRFNQWFLSKGFDLNIACCQRKLRKIKIFCALN